MKLRRNILTICLLLSYYTSHAQSTSKIFETSFEDSLFTNYLRNEKCCPRSITVSTERHRLGKTSLRFELRSNDPIIHKGKRAELAGPFESSTNIERWYGLSIFPEYLHEIGDSTMEIVLQWHEMNDSDLGEAPRSPPISLQIKDGGWRLVVFWTADRVNSDSTVSGKKIFYLGKYAPMEWTDWIFHIKFSFEQDGLIEIWKNNKKSLTYTGPNYYNDRRGPYLKFGIYKPEWNKFRRGVDKQQNRILYFDCLKVLKENAQLSDFSISTEN